MKKPVFLRDLIGCAVLAVLAMGIGLGANVFRSDPLSLKYTRPAERLVGVVSHEGESSVGDWEPGLHLIDLEQMSRIVDDQSAIIVDGRPDRCVEFGHIPGAENLACKEFDEDYQRLEKRLKPAKEGTVPLVICSGLSANS